MLVEVLIFLSSVIFLLGYLVFSYHEKSYFNILSPSFIIQFASFYIFPLIYSYSNSMSVNKGLIYYIYLYVLQTFSFLLGVCLYIYINKKVVFTAKPFNQDVKPYFCVVFLVLAFTFYTPILIKFNQFILTPRRIYELTRSGYGISFFLSSFFFYMAFIIYLTKFRRSLFLDAVWIMTGSIFLLLHGSKGQVVVLFFIYFLSYIYLKEWRVSFKYLVFISLFFIILILALFSFTSKISLARLIQFIASYADYIRNSVLIMASDYPLQHGRLFVESIFYSFLPRELFPSKPYDFGYIKLTKYFFPKSFEAHQGYPAIHSIGRLYADFGLFSAPIFLLFTMIHFAFMSFAVNLIKATKNFINFILIVCASGISIIPTGAGYPEIAVIIISLGVVAVSRQRVSKHNVYCQPK